MLLVALIFYRNFILVSFTNTADGSIHHGFSAEQACAVSFANIVIANLGLIVTIINIIFF